MINPPFITLIDIPAKYAVRHSGSTPKGRSLYLCPYSESCSSPPYGGDLATVGSHVCHYHLGHCILCPYDGLRIYNRDGWKKHMASAHPGAPWYHSQLPAVQYMPGSSTVSTTSTPDTTDTTTLKVVAGSIIPVSVPPDTEDIPEDMLPYVKDEDVDEDTLQAEEDDPTLDTPGIDSYSIVDIKAIGHLAPSDLRQYDYAVGGGGSIMFRYRKDDSKTHSFAEQLAAEEVDTSTPALPTPETGESPCGRNVKSTRYTSSTKNIPLNSSGPTTLMTLERRRSNTMGLCPYTPSMEQHLFIVRGFQYLFVYTRHYYKKGRIWKEYLYIVTSCYGFI